MYADACTPDLEIVMYVDAAAMGNRLLSISGAWCNKFESFESKLEARSPSGCVGLTLLCNWWVQCLRNSFLDPCCDTLEFYISACGHGTRVAMMEFSRMLSLLVLACTKASWSVQCRITIAACHPHAMSHNYWRGPNPAATMQT
jgi:hypothetical protein